MLNLSRLHQFFSRLTPSLAGLDVSRSEVAMVELSRTRQGQVHLARYARETLSESAVTSDGIEELSQVIDTVRRMWDDSGCRARHIALSVPPDATWTKIITARAGIHAGQINRLVQQHTALMLPDAGNHTLADFCVLGPTASRPGYVDMLIVAARKEDVEDRIAVAESLGLKTTVVDISHYALLATLLRIHPETHHTTTKLTLLLDAGTIHAMLVHQGRILSEQCHVVPRKQRPSVHEDYLQRGTSFSTHLWNTPLPDVITLCTKLVQSLQRAVPDVHRDATIMLAGPGSRSPGLTDAIAAQTGIPTKRAMPFAGMSIAPSIDPARLEIDASACAVACGLALRRFD